MISTMPQKPLYKITSEDQASQIGRRIAQIRKAKGLTQQELASTVGITQTLLSSYERGRLRIAAEMLAQIALALGASADQILGIEQEKESEGLGVSRKILKRMRQIEALPASQQRALLTNVDMFLRGAIPASPLEKESSSP